MLKEYALDPELLSNWKDFRYFIEKFGVQYGRLISRYPKHWKSLVYEAAAQCPDVEKKRIEDKLKQLPNQMLVKRINLWKEELDWINNAIQEHSKRPFHAIIARQNPNNHEKILVGDEAEDTHKLMDSPTNIRINRKAKEMAECVQNLLRFSKNINFIDKHFFSNPSKRHIRPLEEFLKILADTVTIDISRKIEIVYHTSDSRPEAYFKGLCESTLPSIIPKGLTIKIVTWPERELHNRYILTDIGGVMFGIGLDDDDFGNSMEKDEISFLAEATYKELWQQFTNKTPLYEIQGRK